MAKPETVVAAYRPGIPPHVAELIRHLPPDLKRSIKQALRALSLQPFSGGPLLRELARTVEVQGETIPHRL